MANDFTRANPNLEQAIRAATNVEQIRELCVAAGEQSHILTRTRSGELIVNDGFVASVTQAPLADSTSGNYTKIIYPFGNCRFELAADSPDQLEEMERRVLQAFGR